MSRRVWDPEDIKRMGKLYKSNTAKQVAQIMGENLQAVKIALQEHKLTGRGMMKFWTDEKCEQLRELYPTTRNVDIAEILGSTKSAVCTQAFKMKLVKPLDFILEHGKKGHFKSGHEPLNKGKKMSPELFEKSKHTMFKKGNIPSNTKTDGAISIRADKRGVKYRFIRISLGKWYSFARYVWEQNHGPIPKGMCIWHKDLDKLNDELDNLELITRAENRIRNSGSILLSNAFVVYTMTVRKSPELKAAVAADQGLIETKRLQLQLNREIKKAYVESTAKKEP